MTQPGSEFYPQPGWFARPGRVGTISGEYGWTSAISGVNEVRGTLTIELASTTAFVLGEGIEIGSIAATAQKATAALAGLHIQSGTLGAQLQHARAAVSGLGAFGVGSAAYVATSESTGSGSYTDLTTTTDTVTVTVPSTGMVLVSIGTGASSGWTSYAMSGANTRSADDDHAVYPTMGAGGIHGVGGVFLETGLVSGSTTFKMKYRSGGSWADRRIAVIPVLE